LRLHTPAVPLGLLVLLLILCPRVVTAQSAWDLAAIGGVLGVHSPVADNQSSYEDWFHTGLYALNLGRHFTRHVKVELEVSGSGTARQYVSRFVAVPGLPGRYPLNAEAETTLRSFSTAATWQFFDNEWVHPFLSAGVQADVERRTLRVWQQPIYPSDPRTAPNQFVVIPEQREGPSTSTTWRPVIGGGVKVYVTPRAFVRADARTTLGAAPQAVSFRGGVGFDF
jgi:hypothetical protein